MKRILRIARPSTEHPTDRCKALVWAANQLCLIDQCCRTVSNFVEGNNLLTYHCSFIAELWTLSPASEPIIPTTLDIVALAAFATIPATPTTSSP